MWKWFKNNNIHLTIYILNNLCHCRKWHSISTVKSNVWELIIRKCNINERGHDHQDRRSKNTYFCCINFGIFMQHFHEYVPCELFNISSRHKTNKHSFVEDGNSLTYATTQRGFFSFSQLLSLSNSGFVFFRIHSIFVVVLFPSV